MGNGFYRNDKFIVYLGDVAYLEKAKYEGWKIITRNTTWGEDMDDYENWIWLREEDYLDFMNAWTQYKEMERLTKHERRSDQNQEQIH